MIFQLLKFILLLLKLVCLKQNVILVISLALFSLLTGYLLSAISFIGKAGISMFYQQYEFLKIWWKGALLVFIVWIGLFLIQNAAYKRVSKANSNIISIVSLLVAIAGLFFSYKDFRNSLSHRWLGERFHLGVYLFWLGCIVISVFFLLKRTSFADTFLTEKTKELY